MRDIPVTKHEELADFALSEGMAYRTRLTIHWRKALWMYLKQGLGCSGRGKCRDNRKLQGVFKEPDEEI